MKNNLSLGVPCYESLTLSMFDLTLTCSNNKKKSIERERYIRTETIKRIEDTTQTKSYNKNIDYLLSINYLTDDNSISYFGLNNRQKMLNVFDSLVPLNKKGSYKELLNTILYNRAVLRSKIDYINTTPYTSGFHQYLKNNYPKIYYGRLKNTDLREYLNNEIEYYNSLIKNLDNIFKLEVNDLFTYYVDSLDESKARLYIAYNYLIECINTSSNNLQSNIFYLTAYLEEYKNTNTKLIINSSYIDYDYIKERYQYILTNNPTLKEIHYKRDFFLNHSKNDNINVIDTLLNMSIIKTNGFVINSESYNDPKNKKYHKKRVPTDEEIIKIKEYLKQKWYQYLKNKPLALITCDNEFSNYKAFLYNNGMVLSDRFLKVNTESEL